MPCSRGSIISEASSICFYYLHALLVSIFSVSLPGCDMNGRKCNNNTLNKLIKSILSYSRISSILLSSLWYFYRVPFCGFSEKAVEWNQRQKCIILLMKAEFMELVLQLISCQLVQYYEMRFGRKIHSIDWVAV